MIIASDSSPASFAGFKFNTSATSRPVNSSRLMCCRSPATTCRSAPPPTSTLHSHSFSEPLGWSDTEVTRPTWAREWGMRGGRRELQASGLG